MGTAQQIYQAYSDLSRELEPLAREIIASVPGVHTIYDPLQYASRPWRAYLQRYMDSPRPVLFLGMNPGPWGMAQTGIPFGETRAVREWMGIDETVDQPPHLHPARPVEGLQCSRSEVSGRRLWNLMSHRFGSADSFFREHAVLNFCPLVFMAESGRNITPDKLPIHFRKPLDQRCEDALLTALALLKPRYLVGVGRFARDRLSRSGYTLAEEPVQILHPSPASPASNRDWAGTVTQQLVGAGVWT